jgi:UDP-perosamine 4-acetyltransferase
LTDQSNTSLSLILIGAGGHAQVLLSTLLQLGRRVLGFVEREVSETELLGVPRLGNDDAVLTYDPQEVLLVNGVGSVASVNNRLRVYESFVTRNYRFAQVIHPSALIAPEAQIGDGVQIMAGAIIQTGCIVYENCIINTGAQLDHDCIIHAHAHVAPGAVLCGSVHVGERVHVGAGSTIIQGVHIESDAVVGGGAVVLSDVAASACVVGVPAKPLRVRA